MSLTVAVQGGGPNSAAQGTPFPGLDNGQFLIYGFFVITPSNAGNGGYVAGGDPLSFAGVNDLLKSGYAPLQTTIQSQSPGLGHSGFVYYYRPGGVGNLATLANGKMQVLSTGAGNQQALAEIPAGAYPAAILADTIVANACFVRV